MQVSEGQSTLKLKKLLQQTTSPDFYCLVISRRQIICEADVLVSTYRFSDVKDDDGRLSSTVVHGRQAVVSLLSRGVPDLKLYCGVI